MTTFQYIDSTGGTYTLGTTARRKLMGFGGVGMVAPEHFWQARPYRAGDEHLGYRVPRRTMNFVVKQAASTRGSAWEQKRDIADAFSPEKGRGRLLVTLPNDTQREIPARYAGGLDFATADSETPWIQDFPIQLVCDGPYWEDPTDGTASANFNGANPVNISCTNDGDVATYPTITISASVEHPVITLSGAEIDINVNLTSGSLVIDCEDPTVTSGGVSKMGSAAPESNFFSLASGSNTIQLTATSGAGACAVNWTEKYEALKK